MSKSAVPGHTDSIAANAQVHRPALTTSRHQRAGFGTYRAEACSQPSLGCSSPPSGLVSSNACHINPTPHSYHHQSQPGRRAHRPQNAGQPSQSCCGSREPPHQDPCWPCSSQPACWEGSPTGLQEACGVATRCPPGPCCGAALDPPEGGPRSLGSGACPQEDPPRLHAPAAPACCPSHRLCASKHQALLAGMHMAGVQH